MQIAYNLITVTICNCYYAQISTKFLYTQLSGTCVCHKDVITLSIYRRFFMEPYNQEPGYVFFAPDTHELTTVQLPDEPLTTTLKNHLSSMIPEALPIMKQTIQSACEQLDYPGSFLHDAYPDKISFHCLGDQIYDEISNRLSSSYIHSSAIHNTFHPHLPTCTQPCGSPFCPPPPKPWGSREEPNVLRALVNTSLIEEICKRRRRKSWH